MFDPRIFKTSAPAASPDPEKEYFRFEEEEEKVYLNMLDQAIYQNMVDQQIDLNMFYQTTPRQMNKFHGSSTASRQGSLDKVVIIVTVTSALTFCRLPGIGFLNIHP